MKTYVAGQKGQADLPSGWPACRTLPEPWKGLPRPLERQHLIELGRLHQHLVAAEFERPRFLRPTAVGGENQALADHAKGSDALGLAGLPARSLYPDPDESEYRSDLASVYTNLGVVFNLSGRHEDALAALDQAREIEDRLAEEHPNNPDYQSRLATTLDRLANVHSNVGGQFTAAETAYQKALAVRERLASEHPEVVQFQRDLAGSHNNLASLYGNQGIFPKAEAESEASRETLRRLVARHPDVPIYRNDLALALSNLAILYDRTDRPKEALAAWSAAADARRQLVKEYPGAIVYAVDLGTTYVDLARLTVRCGQMEPAVEYYAKAVAVLEPIRDNDADGVAIRRTLWNARVGRAETLGHLGRHADAVTDWQAAIELDTGDRRDGLRLKRAESLARAGRHDDAFRETKDLFKLASGNGWVLHQLAAIRALAMAAVYQDDSLAAAERQRLGEQYAGAALEALRRAAAEGYFDDLAAVKDLKDDPRMEPLRNRRGFRQFVERLDASG